MTKEVFLALLTEDGLSCRAGRPRASGQPRSRPTPNNVAHRTAANVRGLGREMLSAMKRLRDLQRARGATHRPDL